MSHYTKLYKYGKPRKRDFFKNVFSFILVFYFEGVFNKTIITLALFEYGMIVANKVPPSLATYHFISNKLPPN